MRIFLLLILFPIALIGQDNHLPSSFRSLEEIKIEEYKGAYAFLPKGFRLEQNKTLLANEWEVLMQPIAWVYLKKGIESSKVLLVFSGGLSDDPAFEFYKQRGDSLIDLLYLSGLKVFLPGNGNIYVSGHANNMFDTKRKYVFADDTIREVSQPFQHVGLKTSCKEAIVLFQGREGKKILARLPKEAEIEVLMAESKDSPEWFLIKTSFGLVGWWKLDSYYSQKIRGLYFAGD